MLGVELIDHDAINNDRVRMRLEPRKEQRTCFVDTHVMLLVNTYPEVEIARGAEVEDEQAVHRENAVHINLELPPELVETDIDLVYFSHTYIENVMHQPLIFFSMAVVE